MASPPAPEYVQQLAKDNALLLEWHSQFEAEFGSGAEAKPTLTECDEVANLFKSKVEKIKVAMEVKSARNSRKGTYIPLPFDVCFPRFFFAPDQNFPFGSKNQTN